MFLFLISLPGGKHMCHQQTKIPVLKDNMFNIKLFLRKNQVFAACLVGFSLVVGGLLSSEDCCRGLLASLAPLDQPPTREFLVVRRLGIGRPSWWPSAQGSQDRRDS